MTTSDILTLVGLFLGSTGLWTLIYKLIDHFSARKKHINEAVDKLSAISLGLAYDRCKHVAEQYIRRGWITTSEYNDYIKYLYQPYHDAGGDGTIDKLKSQLDELPIDSHEGGKPSENNRKGG